MRRLRPGAIREVIVAARIPTAKALRGPVLGAAIVRAPVVGPKLVAACVGPTHILAARIIALCSGAFGASPAQVKGRLLGADVEVRFGVRERQRQLGHGV